MLHVFHISCDRIVDAKLGRLLCLLMGVGFYTAGFLKVILRTILVSRSMVKSYSVLHTCVVCTSLYPWDHME